MRFRVYTPRTLEIDEGLIPGLKEKARKRLQLREGADVAERHIIEEARRAGLIELGRDYVLDLESAQRGRKLRAGRRGRGRGRAARAKKGMAASAGG
jgi:hypothetical protein